MNNNIYKKKTKKFQKEEAENQKKLEILQDLFSILHITITNKFDLVNVEIDRDSLLEEPFYSYAINYKSKLKPVYKSSKYNCIHSNSVIKQKYPSINLIRQVLKSNQLRLHPHYVSCGYDEYKNKLVKRYFTIKPLDMKK